MNIYVHTGVGLGRGKLGAIRRRFKPRFGSRRQHQARDYDIDRWHSDFLAALQGPREMEASSNPVARDDGEWTRSRAA